MMTVKQKCLTTANTLIDTMREAGLYVPLNGHVEIHLKEHRVVGFRQGGSLMNFKDIEKIELLDQLP